MRPSPRQRRLQADFSAVLQLREQSSIFRFQASGSPPQIYRFLFYGNGVFRKPNGAVKIRQEHAVQVELGASYPRMIPHIAWHTPIFHPNISANGIVCLGGYGTHWVPSLSLDEMCVMLWDMIRYANFDPNSPYNRDAAFWAKTQDQHRLPLDLRPLRDLATHDGRTPGERPIAGAPPRVVVDSSEIVEARLVAEPNKSVVGTAEQLNRAERQDRHDSTPSDAEVLFLS